MVVLRGVCRAVGPSGGAKGQSYPALTSARKCAVRQPPRGEKIPRKFSPRRGLGPRGESRPGAPSTPPVGAACFGQTGNGARPSRGIAPQTLHSPDRETPARLPRHSTVLADRKRAALATIHSA